MNDEWSSVNASNKRLSSSMVPPKTTRKKIMQSKSFHPALIVIFSLLSQIWRPNSLPSWISLSFTYKIIAISKLVFCRIASYVFYRVAPCIWKIKRVVEWMPWGKKPRRMHEICDVDGFTFYFHWIFVLFAVAVVFVLPFNFLSSTRILVFFIVIFFFYFSWSAVCVCVCAFHPLSVGSN